MAESGFGTRGQTPGSVLNHTPDGLSLIGVTVGGLTPVFGGKEGIEW